MSNGFLDRLSAVGKALPQAVYRAWLGGDRVPPPPGVTTELGQRLWTMPRPLIHSQARMILIFSHKAACTNAVIWFLHHLGHGKAAFDYHVWPHEYRDNVYYATQLYQQAYDLDLAAFKVIRIVRDPWERAVSSFRHALEWDYADGAFAKLLRRRDVAAKGLAFAEFLDLLERSELSTCDLHYRMQRHPVEDMLPVHHLINVSTQNLFTRLNEVEADLGLPATDLANMPWSRMLEAHHRPLGTFGDITDVYKQRLSKEAARLGPWPPYSALLTPEARERIARIYATDIATYLKPSAGPDG